MKATKTMQAAKTRTAELTRLAAKPDRHIDTSDIPETSGWSRAIVGRFHRPVN